MVSGWKSAFNHLHKPYFGRMSTNAKSSVFVLEDIFEWRRILINDMPVEFLLEVAFRTIVMFFFLVVTLRLAGKRGVKQLSIYEVVIIVALGSAAGDPMFYKDVGLIPALLVFTIVMGLYRLITSLAGRFVVAAEDDFAAAADEQLVVTTAIVSDLRRA